MLALITCRIRLKLCSIPRVLLRMAIIRYALTAIQICVFTAFSLSP